ncbi:cytoplasmic protein [Clavulina sp. PMI_390]|nr:cytoplasmic protein [Clavulina sp. PMI_390]
MVIFFKSVSHDPEVVIFMGKDKFENEDLIKYSIANDIWFHVDNLSSAHVYLRLPENIPDWKAIPEALLVDCAQLVKANSIEGNKKDNITVIYTPCSNLKKDGGMATGQVGFHNDKLVKKVHIPTRQNVIVNRLNKTKEVREVDHEAEKLARTKKEGAAKKAQAQAKKKEEEEERKRRAEEKAAKSYDNLVVDEEAPRQSVQEMEDDFM